MSRIGQAVTFADACASKETVRSYLRVDWYPSGNWTRPACVAAARRSAPNAVPPVSADGISALVGGGQKVGMDPVRDAPRIVEPTHVRATFRKWYRRR